MDANELLYEQVREALEAAMSAIMVGDFDTKAQYEVEIRARALIGKAKEALDAQLRNSGPEESEER